MPASNCLEVVLSVQLVVISAFRFRDDGLRSVVESTVNSLAVLVVLIENESEPKPNILDTC